MNDDLDPSRGILWATLMGMIFWALLAIAFL